MNEISIYGLVLDGKIHYVGKTNSVKRRLTEHKKKMKEDKHTAKTLNGKHDEVSIIELGKCKDNSFIVAICEGAFNSIYQPKNGNVIQQMNRKISLNRIEYDEAVAILKGLEDVGSFEFTMNIDKELKLKQAPKKKGIGKKSNIK